MANKKINTEQKKETGKKLSKKETAKTTTQNTKTENKEQMRKTANNNTKKTVAKSKNSKEKKAEAKQKTNVTTTQNENTKKKNITKNKNIKEKKDILWEGVLIAATNYIITNQEYGTLAENYYNYLGGINETAECLIATEEESDSTDGTEIAACLMILSEMMSRQANRDLTE